MLRLMSKLTTLILLVAAICVGGRAYADAPVKSTETPAKSTESIVLAGGCFWGVQAVFQHTKGVVTAMSGYAGGKADTAHYDMVSSGNTGHAESVEVTYDPKQIALDQLLGIYFTVAHDPTQLNYQGPDHGTQYRSAVFYRTPQQQKAVQEYISKLKASAPVVTTLEPLNAFYPAENYHQNYATRHPDSPYIMAYDAPKITALQKMFPELYVK